MILKLRNLLIQKLAGKSTIVLNAAIKGTVHIKGGKALIVNSKFIY